MSPRPHRTGPNSGTPRDLEIPRTLETSDSAVASRSTMIGHPWIRLVGERSATDLTEREQAA